MGTYDVDLGADGDYELTDESGTTFIDDVTKYNYAAGEIRVALRNAGSGNGLTRIRFNEGGDGKLRSVDQWGSAIAWTTMEHAFNGCTKMDVRATDVSRPKWPDQYGQYVQRMYLPYRGDKLLHLEHQQGDRYGRHVLRRGCL